MSECKKDIIVILASEPRETPMSFTINDTVYHNVGHLPHRDCQCSFGDTDTLFLFQAKRWVVAESTGGDFFIQVLYPSKLRTGVTYELSADNLSGYFQFYERGVAKQKYFLKEGRIKFTSNTSQMPGVFDFSAIDTLSKRYSENTPYNKMA